MLTYCSPWLYFKIFFSYLKQERVRAALDWAVKGISLLYSCKKFCVYKIRDGAARKEGSEAPSFSGVWKFSENAISVLISEHISGITFTQFLHFFNSHISIYIHGLMLVFDCQWLLAFLLFELFVKHFTFLFSLLYLLALLTAVLCDSYHLFFLAIPSSIFPGPTTHTTTCVWSFHKYFLFYGCTLRSIRIP